MKILEDIKTVLPFDNGAILGLNLSVLFYIAVLPFNTFGFRLFFTHHIVKYTEVALLFIFIFGVYAYWKRHLVIKRAPWLYTFLLLNAVAQLFSIINAPLPVDSWNVGLAVIQYSILVFILVNAFHSESLRKVVLMVMAVALFVIVVHSFAIFLMQGGVFHVGRQPSLIGNRIGNYLAYLLVMYGAGLLFLLFYEKKGELRYILWLAVALWMYIVILTGVKAAHIAMGLLLILLFATIQLDIRTRFWHTFYSIRAFIESALLRWSARKKVALLVALYLILFVFQLNIVIIIDKSREVNHFISQKAARLDDEFSFQADRIVDFFTKPWNPSLPKLARTTPQKEEDQQEIATSLSPTAESSPSFSPFLPPSPPPPPLPPPPLPPRTNLVEIAKPLSTALSMPVQESLPLSERLTMFDALITSYIESINDPSLASLLPSAPVSKPSMPVLSSPSLKTQLSPSSPKYISISEIAAKNTLKARWTGSGGQSSSDLRARGILAGWYMGLAHPLSGVGAGQSGFFFNHFSELVRDKGRDSLYLSFLPEFFRLSAKSNVKFTIGQSNTHNIFFNAWAETGLLGLFGIVGIISVVILASIRTLWKARHRGSIRTIHFLFPVLMALLFIHQTVFLFVHPWIWSILALTYAAADLDTETLKHENIKTV